MWSILNFPRNRSPKSFQIILLTLCMTWENPTCTFLPWRIDDWSMVSNRGFCTYKCERRFWFGWCVWTPNGEHHVGLRFLPQSSAPKMIQIGKSILNPIKIDLKHSWLAVCQNAAPSWTWGQRSLQVFWRTEQREHYLHQNCYAENSNKFVILRQISRR